MKTNQDLRSFYESIYQKGEQSYFSKFENGVDKSENDDVVIKNLTQIKGKKILDIGCGTGELVLTCPHFYNFRGLVWISLQKLLTNALRDAKLPNDKVSNLLSWFEDLILYNKDNKVKLEGANCSYQFVKD